MNDRIKCLRNELDISQTKFGERLGVSRDVINNLEQGRVDLKEHMIKLICSEFNVDYDWLKYGEGEMFMQPDTSALAAIDAIMTGENEFAKETFKEFASLSKEEWELIQKIVNKLAKK